MQTPLVALPLFGIGLTEWIIIGLAIVLFFGATKLPKLGRGLGEGIRNFKRGIKGELDEDGNPLVESGGANEEAGAPEAESPSGSSESSKETV
jgi:sec-independent protein translocase protein TatA